VIIFLKQNHGGMNYVFGKKAFCVVFDYFFRLYTLDKCRFFLGARPQKGYEKNYSIWRAPSFFDDYFCNFPIKKIVGASD